MEIYHAASQIPHMTSLRPMVCVMTSVSRRGAGVRSGGGGHAARKVVCRRWRRFLDVVGCLSLGAAHRDNSTSRLAKSSSGPSRRLKLWLYGLSYTLNSFLSFIFTNHCYFPLGLSIIAFPFQASIHINTKSARLKGRTYLADDPLCIHLHNKN